jgi:8-oxo-dGTP diphosphatase
MVHDFTKQKPIIKAASACVWRGEEVLLIQRASALGKGRWSLPGGKVEAGESFLAAAHRELLEEAGVTAALDHEVGDFTVETAGVIYMISCFTGHIVSGEAAAASDAGAVSWTHWRSLSDYNLAPNIVEAVELAHNLISV